MNEEIQQQIITWVSIISTLALLGTIILLQFSQLHPDEIVILISITSTGIGILGGFVTGTKTSTEKNEEESWQMNQ